jgi:hypothetical protein
VSRLEQRLHRALAWWMSAPMDERAAVVLIVGPVALLFLVLACLPPPSPGR